MLVQTVNTITGKRDIKEGARSGFKPFLPRLVYRGSGQE